MVVPDLAAAPRPAPGLAPAELQRVVDQHINELRLACYEPYAPRIPLKDVRLNLHIEVAASGRVDLARVQGDQPIVASCVEQRARSWTFPSSDGRSVGEAPVVFVRIDGQPDRSAGSTANKP